MSSCRPVYLERARRQRAPAVAFSIACGTMMSDCILESGGRPSLRKVCPMKRDLDALMTARNLDAILVSGKVLGNPPLVYLLNGAHVTRAVLIKKRGETPTLIVGPMDRGSAAQAGYPVVLTTRYEYNALLEQHGGDELAASVTYYQRIFADLGITGRLGCYGYLDQGYAYVPDRSECCNA